jgi:hypothetical protein
VVDPEKHRAHIFYVDSRFERLARRPGGVTRDHALAQAQNQVESLKPEFDDWLDRELQRLRTAVGQIDRDPADKDALDSAELTCAQIRDIGTTMDSQLVTFVASSLCAVLDAMKEGAAYDRETVECHLNALLLVKTESYRNLRPDQVPEMTAGLRRVVAKTRSNSERSKA